MAVLAVGKGVIRPRALLDMAVVLLELNVENLLLIGRAGLRFAPGLNVLTGETGAGKTVLAHALDLLLGGRPRAGIVRPGASEAYVEGVFQPPPSLLAELRERLPEGTEEIVLARRVGADGRTRAYVCGRTTTVTELRDLGTRLVSFYGQHEHRRLTLARAQLQILDDLCGAEQATRLDACAHAHRLTVRLGAELEQLAELAGARERELDLLEHELAEIDAVAPDQSEHERLLGARDRLRRLDALAGASAGAVQALAPAAPEDPGAVALLAGAASQLEGVTGVDARLDGLAERLRGIAVEAQDLVGELRDHGEGLAGEDGSLEQVEERLDANERLMRKHGGSIAAVLDHGARARTRRDQLVGADGALVRGAARLEDAQGELERAVQALRSARERAAPELARGVREQLSELAMAGAGFEVCLSRCEPGPSGGDRVEMLIAPNPGVPAAPLREVASGGELSRAMLAVIAASAGAGTAEADAVAEHPTLVFDEIDAGIGGHAARAVGERLRGLGGTRQVLCITHLPQIASLGTRHFSVVKDTSSDPALASVVELGEREVVSELVRMLGAEDGDAAARRHARDLRKAA